ncbi:hypothetical protein Golax_017902 [Gossypium laxum]|uniref:Uncharacterized protein n=1 Tax=Gossypium laxum TaxID=34288 RepID=A0A7J8Z397_9ROSI|nr:hypothetical protein [Gossypium laxum]
MALLRCLKIQVDKAYPRAVYILTFLKKLMNIIGINTKKKVDIFALSIYGLVVFPKPWDMLMKQSLISLTDLIRGLHWSRKFGLL